MLKISNAGQIKSSAEMMNLSGRYARHALRISGEYSGFYPEHINKDKEGKPKCCNGIYWSITHKTDCVAGIVSNSPIGIDIEKIKSVSEPLFEKICKPEEKCIFGQYDRDLIFFRCFTAKEAVLKLTGIGLRGLNDTRIVDTLGQSGLITEYKGNIYKIEHLIIDELIISVVKNNSKIIWDYIIA